MHRFIEAHILLIQSLQANTKRIIKTNEFSIRIFIVHSVGKKCKLTLDIDIYIYINYSNLHISIISD